MNPGLEALSAPSTSSMSSLYNTPAGGIFAGHRIANYTDSRVGPVTQENVELVKRYLDGMLMHRVSGGSLLGADGIVQLGQTEPPCPLCDFDAWTKEFGTFIDGRDTPFGLKQARITAFQVACNSQIHLRNEMSSGTARSVQSFLFS